MIRSESLFKNNPRWLDYLIALTFLFFAAGFSFYNLGGPSIWVDEAYTWLFSQFPWENLLESARIDGVNPPLFYVGIKLIASFTAGDEAGLRLLSGLANLTALTGALILGHRISGRLGMVVSGWFWAFHPMALWYARDARPYALAAAFAVILLLAFIDRESQPRSTRWLISTVLIMSLGLVTHYFFLLLVAGLTTYRVYQLREKPELFREWASMLLAALVPLAIWIYWYLQQTQPSLGIGWIEAPSIFDLPGTIWNLISGYGGVLSVPSTIYGIIGSTLILIAIRQSESKSRAIFASVFGLALPILAVWIISQRRSVYIDRYFIVLLPFVLILLSKGANSLVESIRLRTSAGGQSVSYALLLIVLVVSGVWSAGQIHNDVKFEHEAWRDLVAQHDDFVMEDDKIWLMEPEAQLPMSFYGLKTLDIIETRNPPRCDPACWWVLRQPYTSTHAFTQSVGQPGRPWIPEIPNGCFQSSRWDSATGIALWKVTCGS